MNTIVFVCGKLCCGKNTICKQLQNIFVESKHIVVSDVVKHITGFISRANLQSTSHLDKEISKYIVEQLQPNGVTIIDGIRQPEIYENIISTTPDSKIITIWIESSPHIRKERFEQRRDIKDSSSKTFEQYELGDIALGIDDLRSKIPFIVFDNNNDTLDITNLIDAINALL